MEQQLLHNHQHSHVHSHLHVHPQNPPPPGSSIFPSTVPQVNDPVVNPYALALQNQALNAAAVDPAVAAAGLCDFDVEMFYICLKTTVTDILIQLYIEQNRYEFASTLPLLLPHYIFITSSASKQRKLKLRLVSIRRRLQA